MTRFFYDCEFIENGSTIDLISIGIVCEDGRELYLQSLNFNPAKANEWVKGNVFPHLKQCPHRPGSLVWQIQDHLQGIPRGQCTFEDPDIHTIGAHTDCPWRTRSQIKYELIDFLTTGDKIELWGYYSAYDHVALCQLFGTMMDLPQGWPMYTRDLKQWCDDLGNPKLPIQEGPEHNALADARWNKSVYDFLMVTQGMQYLKMQRQWKESNK